MWPNYEKVTLSVIFSDLENWNAFVLLNICIQWLLEVNGLCFLL